MNNTLPTTILNIIIIMTNFKKKKLKVIVQEDRLGGN